MRYAMLPSSSTTHTLDNFRGKPISTESAFAGGAVAHIIGYALSQELGSSGGELLALAVDDPEFVGGSAVWGGVHFCCLHTEVEAGQDPCNHAKQAGVILDLHLQHLCIAFVCRV